MTQKIKRELLTANFEKERYLSELQILTAQIKPHFLFNLLGNISAMRLTEPRAAHRALGNLSLYLRNALSSDKLLHSVNDELYLLEKYIELQKLRLLDRLRFSLKITDCSPALLQMTEIPTFTLLTLCENSIVHAAERKSQGCDISLTIKKEPQQIHFQICDNGSGVKPEKLNSLLSNIPNQDNENHYSLGLYNIHNRLLHLCHSTGLTLKSSWGNYFIVEFYLHEKNIEDGAIC